MHVTPIFGQIAKIYRSVSQKEPEFVCLGREELYEINTELSQLSKYTHKHQILNYCAPTLPIDLCEIKDWRNTLVFLRPRTALRLPSTASTAISTATTTKQWR